MLTPAHMPGRAQRGVALIEALVAILVFSIGVIGLIGLLGIGVKTTSDAKYRADAAYLANQLMAKIWVDNHDDAAVIGGYQHRPSGSNCSWTGTDASNAYVTGAWMTDVTARLPGATSANQQVIVDTANNLVTVTLCWRQPQETSYHRYTASAQIRG